MLNIQLLRKALPRRVQSPLGNWGWLGGIGTAAIMAALNLKVLLMAASSIFLLAHAKIAAMSAGKFASALNSFGGSAPSIPEISLPGLPETLALNLMMGALVPSLAGCLQWGGRLSGRGSRIFV